MGTATPFSAIFIKFENAWKQNLPGLWHLCKITDHHKSFPRWLCNICDRLNRETKAGIMISTGTIADVGPTSGAFSDFCPFWSTDTLWF